MGVRDLRRLAGGGLIGLFRPLPASCEDGGVESVMFPAASRSNLRRLAVGLPPCSRSTIVRRGCEGGVQRVGSLG